MDRYLENQFRYPLERERLGSEGQQINHSRRENPLFILPDCITNTVIYVTVILQFICM